MVHRTGDVKHNVRDGVRTLEQAFRFDRVTSDAIERVLLEAPLVGPRSIFGNRPGREFPVQDGTRRLSGFSPAPMFVFDVTLKRVERGVFVVNFAQPDRRTPYLSGDLVWLVSDEVGGAVFDEQINTERAMEHATQPLGGPRTSLRRWLFFRVGHVQVMNGAVQRIARLVE